MALIDEYGFENRTILMAGAACAAGAVLATFYARSGARVVLIDQDEAAILTIARRFPERIDALRFDVMRPDLCRRLGQLWEDEPISALIHLQALRSRTGPGAHLTSIETLSLALAPGLGGQGRVAILYPVPDGQSAAGKAALAAYEAMPATLQDRLGGQGVLVNALRLPQVSGRAARQADLIHATAFLTRPDGARLGGAVLPLLPRSD